MYYTNNVTYVSGQIESTTKQFSSLFCKLGLVLMMIRRCVVFVSTCDHKVNPFSAITTM